MSKRRSKISRKLSQLPNGRRNRIISQDDGHENNHISDLSNSLYSFTGWYSTVEGPDFWTEVTIIIDRKGLITSKEYNNINRQHGFTGL